MHGTFTNHHSSGDNVFHLIAAHRAACAVRDAACMKHDRLDEDEECPAAQMARDHMHRAFDVERGVLDEIMLATPTSVAGLAALILHVDAVNRQQDDFGNDNEGRAEILISRLTRSVRLTKAV
jgi:hypothetical protein